MPKPAAHPNLVLAICCMSLLLVSMDVTIVNVALPAMQRDLHTSLSQLQWVVDAYTLVVASLLMFSGSMSDRFGRRLTFQIGLIWFCLGSLACSLTHTIGGLIAFRAVQGIGASMLNPVALSIIANVFPNPKDRARAVGIWGAVAGASLGLGPVIGGILTQTVGWRAIFWINLPIGALAIILAATFVPESKAPRARRFDPVGQLLVFTTLVAVTYAVIEGPDAGWHSRLILGLFAFAAVTFTGFLLYEPRRTDPLVDLRFFRSVPFSSAALLALLSFSCFAGSLFLNALYLQGERHFTAVHTGLMTLPIAVAMFFSAPLSGRLVANHGPRWSVMIAGGSLLLSPLLLTQLSLTTPVPLLLTAYALFGLGLGMVNPAISNSAVAGMPLTQAGVAAAITSTSRQVGAALGVAIAGTVVATSRAHHNSFTHATHPIWWLMALSGATVLTVGYLSTTEWALGTTKKVATLFQ